MATGSRLHRPVAPPIDSLEDWLAALTRPTVLTEIATLAGCVLLAWLITRLVARTRREVTDNSIFFGRRMVDGVMFPLLLLSLAYAAEAALAQFFPLALFRVAIPALMALAVIRLGVKVLQVAFKNAPVVRALERTFSWLAWLAMVLWVSGLLPIILDELDQIKWKIGATQLSVRTLIEGILTASVVVLITLWISAALETRLLRSASGNELSVRKALSNALRVVLMFVGLLVALSSVGIDLTALSVLGGAIGVGVGFGLQKLAASYVSGFVMLTERSVRIGDMVRVDTFEGKITDIRARYTMVRALSGRESIVPNEMFINNRVENLSLIELRAMQSITLTVRHDSDVGEMRQLLVDAALAHERVLKDPAPAASLNNFTPDGLEFVLTYWMTGPEPADQSLRSSINLAIWKSLNSKSIALAVPQRMMQGQWLHPESPKNLENADIVETNDSDKLPATQIQPVRPL